MTKVWYQTGMIYIWKHCIYKYLMEFYQNIYIAVETNTPEIIVWDVWSIAAFKEWVFNSLSPSDAYMHH